MKVLVIDSHKSSSSKPADNLHWLNARILADHFGGDLIWSYPGVNDQIRSDYDAIIFVHASHYAYTDYAWIEQSPNARLFYVTNEYNLGEPRTLWMAAKRGRRYQVIANHDGAISKVVKKYVDQWHVVNLNALVFKGEPTPTISSGLRRGCVYYGSFRKDRVASFVKYLHEPVTLSTHRSNEAKFRAVGVTSPMAPRLKWSDGRQLGTYLVSLYLEDEVTHTSYNHLANRFYEALNHGVAPLFAEDCRATVERSGYPIGDEYFVGGLGDIEQRLTGDTLFPPLPASWYARAATDRSNTLNFISQLVSS